MAPALPQSSITATAISNPLVLVALRGGGLVQEESLNVARAAVRVEGIDTYSILAALLLQAALKLYSTTPKDLESSVDKKEKFQKFLFIFSSTLSMICGAYTTVIFSLLCLYSKTALGLGKDSAFVDFFTATAAVQKKAFISFLVSLVSFEVCFITSLSLKYEGRLRSLCVIVASIIITLSWIHWQMIVSTASRLLPGH